MKTSFDFPLAGMRFSATIAKKILSEPLPGESAISRMKQIAFITVIFQMQMARALPDGGRAIADTSRNPKSP
jgi:hypothetical protein